MVLISPTNQSPLTPGRRTSTARLEKSGVSLVVSYFDHAERQQIFAAASQFFLDRKTAFPFSNFVGSVMLTGLSPEQALDLRWEAPAGTDLLAPWLNLKAWEIVVPFNGTSRHHKRCVPIVPQLGHQLADWPFPKEGKLFPFTVSAAHVDDLWDKTLKMAHVRHIDMHNLRDTFAMMLREAGLSVSETLEILGRETAQ